MNVVNTYPNDRAILGRGRRAIFLRVAIIGNIDRELVYWEDLAAAGLYKVQVPAEMDDTTAATCALGGFHSTVPIERLDRFELTVYGACGGVLEPDYDRDWYEHADQCGEVDCCSRDSNFELPVERQLTWPAKIVDARQLTLFCTDS